MSLVTLSKYKTYRKITTSSDDAYHQALIDAASAAVENFCNRKFAKQEGVVEFLTTNGLRFLTLKRTPVWSVAEVRLDYYGRFGQFPDAFNDSTLLTEGDNYALEIDDPSGSGLSYSGRLLRTDGYWSERATANPAGQLWTPNIPSWGNVKVTYTGGYETIPEDVQSATTQVAAATALNFAKGAPLKSERLGQGSYELDLAAIQGGAFGALQMLGSARQVLTKYRKVAW